MLAVLEVDKEKPPAQSGGWGRDKRLCVGAILLSPLVSRFGVRRPCGLRLDARQKRFKRKAPVLTRAFRRPDVLVLPLVVSLGNFLFA